MSSLLESLFLIRLLFIWPRLLICCFWLSWTFQVDYTPHANPAFTLTRQHVTHLAWRLSPVGVARLSSVFTSAERRQEPKCTANSTPGHDLLHYMIYLSSKTSLKWIIVVVICFWYTWRARLHFCFVRRLATWANCTSDVCHPPYSMYTYKSSSKS